MLKILGKAGSEDTKPTNKPTIDPLKPKNEPITKAGITTATTAIEANFLALGSIKYSEDKTLPLVASIIALNFSPLYS